MSAANPAPHGTSAANSAPRRAALASFFGTAVEYYDFFVYGTAAALAFNKVFFPKADPATGTLLALATYGVAYVARPVGALVLGHLGDRIGRKRILVFTLALMGLSTFSIGCLPDYRHIGLWAPGLLIALRLLQGFSAGGEQSGASSLTLEHAPAHRRGFFTSWTLSGSQAGLILATLIFIPITSLPKQDQLDWAWRVPFLLSAVVVAVAFVIRLRMPETPAFQEAQDKHELAKLPVAELLRDQWGDVLRVLLCAFVAVVSTVTAVFGLSYATDQGISKTTMLWAVVVANVFALGFQPVYAIISDRIGRKPVFIAGVLACGVIIYPYFMAITSGNVLLVFLGAVAITSVAYSAPNAIWPSFYNEMFPTRVRYSGVAIGTQLGFLLAGFTPTIGKAIETHGRNGWVPVAIFTSACCLISAIAAATARETYNVGIEDLGRRGHARADDWPSTTIPTTAGQRS
ncbi:MHS family MFS transporter [Jatrophihabitans telluris]|uniref:MHS family MFS transporter n=1 Tax=Jatrophihabitans telluris TaxID=2038343 RepID=A0ABY4R454_9ACTN|nr:MFS transporter [Jatrophihabitans telluris]UQX89739.1 MHS family MFS transporter [Jatrophihabitans telluris]